MEFEEGSAAGLHQSLLTSMTFLTGYVYIHTYIYIYIYIFLSLLTGYICLQDLFDLLDELFVLQEFKSNDFR